MTAEIHFDFVAPHKTVFGWGRGKEIGSLARALGDRAFLATGSRTLAKAGVFDDVIRNLKSAGVSTACVFSVMREPEPSDVDRAAEVVRSLSPRPGDFVVAIGGGSALDFGKALAALATNSAAASVVDYLEGVGKGLRLDREPLPILAAPTTAGTGSEATRNAVVSSRNPPFKKSLRSERLVPRIALIDPEWTASNPPSVTAHSGMDALTQLLESYLSRKATPLTQSLAIEGLRDLVPALHQAYRDGSCRSAREKTAYAAYLSGVALGNSGLGMAHGVAAALGCTFGTPHGLACAVMLPIALRANAPVCNERFVELCEVVTGSALSDPSTAQERIFTTIDALSKALKIPRLSELGVRTQDLPALAVASQGSSMSGNPRQFSDAELCEVLADAL